MNNPSNQSELLSILKDIGTKTGTILISNNIDISSRFIIPENVQLYFSGNGALTVASGITFYIYSLVSAAEKQIFFGSGTVKISKKDQNIKQQWWGIFDCEDCGVIISTTPPENVSDGALWLNSTDNSLYVFNESLNQWILTSSSSTGGASVTVGDIPPAVPSDGDLWWNTENGNLYLYYNDGDSSQWVIATSVISSGTNSGSSVIMSSVPPSEPKEGMLWWNKDVGNLLIYYVDDDSSQWVDACSIDNTNTSLDLTPQ